MDEKAKTELAKPLSTKHIASRSQSGRQLSYLEGWHVIAEANRIFGFDGWTRETIDMREVRPPELVKSSSGKETWRVGFVCKVRVTVGDVVREGTGYGSGSLPDLGEAYESAVKEAETDAMKRALMTFGNPFGLALYDKSQANIADEPEPPTESEKRLHAKLKGELAKDIHTLDELGMWAKKRENIDAFKDLPDDLRSDLQAAMVKLREALTPKGPLRAQLQQSVAEARAADKNLIMAG